jgi:hypothetical protein
MTPIRFPDGASHTPTALRAQHTLRLTGKAWTASGIVATYDDGFWRVEIDSVPHCFRHDPEGQRYTTGGWPNAIPTAFVLRRCSGGTVKDGIILEIYDVAYGGHGPDHVPGVDTP